MSLWHCHIVSFLCNQYQVKKSIVVSPVAVISIPDDVELACPMCTPWLFGAVGLRYVPPDACRELKEPLADVNIPDPMMLFIPVISLTLYM